MGAHSRINTILLTTILIVIIITILYTYSKTQKMKKRFIEIKNSLIPRFRHNWYKRIVYPHTWPQDTRQLLSWGKGGTIRTRAIVTVCSFLMATYNVAMGKDSFLPSYAKIIGRMGTHGLVFETRNAIILCFRGTLGTHDIMNDIDAIQTSFLDSTGRSYPKISVHRGFERLWESLAPQARAFERAVKRKGKHVIIAGHSLGGSTAYLSALSLVKSGWKKGISLVTLATPKVGNQNFVNEIQCQNIENCVIVNQNDIVPTLPPSAFSFGGTSWVYAAFDETVLIDIQTGDLQENHALHAYALGISGNNICDLTLNIVWAKRPKKIMSLPIRNLQGKMCAVEERPTKNWL